VKDIFLDEFHNNIEVDDMEYFFNKYLSLKKKNSSWSNVQNRIMVLKRLKVILEAEYEEAFYKNIEHEQQGK